MSDDAPPKLQLSTTEFVTALSHFYRGEMYRSTVWRTRLDITTNWAIITTAAFLSFGFGHPDIPHFVIILATIFVLFFLIIEIRRYKYFDLFRWRVALVSENFFAIMFTPSQNPIHENWRELLSGDLQHPRFKITFLEAFGRRLRRNYSWIFLVLAVCWLTKVSIHPTPVVHFSDILKRADVFHLLPGWLVIVIGVIFNMSLFVMAIFTLKPREEVVRIYPSKKSRIKLTNI
ncbi:MAG TPA: DUF2270 domain-containing protein [bacterium]